MGKKQEFVAMARKALRSILLILPSLAVTWGCANHHCRLQKKGANMAEIKLEEKSKRVLVGKSDGSRQCENHSGISLEKMAQDLKDIKIYHQSKQNDGLMRIQVCGAPTGLHNVYEIDEIHLKKAKDVGFEVWKGPKDNE